MNILELSHNELLALCTKQEAELEQLRPKPPKFRKQQVVFCISPPRFLQILRVKQEHGRYYYSHRMNDGPGNYDNPSHWIWENHLRSLSQTEIQGEETNAESTSNG